MTQISLIVALASNGVIGLDGGLPWRLPDDLRYFRQVTLGKPVVMGRKTYESIGRPLPGRENIILTRQPNYPAPGCTVVHSVAAALAAAGSAPEIMVIGGAEIYRLFLPLAHRLYLTLVAATPAGDTFMPNYDPAGWRETSRTHHPADNRHPFPFDWIILERRHP
ncbi:MAG: type 3 dihydrofolate reductase [Ardenticatenaceae bacterium]|nr:type 3 dihydrofolate reductase [Ardenticatenaceae bacterium]